MRITNQGVFLVDEDSFCLSSSNEIKTNVEEARKNTISYRILKNHNKSDNMDKLNISFDALISHDITYVGIIQTARASGLESFPIPYVLTNCHNSLCAVGGTINEDDHVFGLSCAKKYGGAFVPPHQAVIHQYAREIMAKPGAMILGSDSHTRYGALGTMAVGEGGPELVKQLLGQTYDINMPEIVGVYLKGTPIPGVGPQDVALALIGAVFSNGFVKNKVLEFVGPGIRNLSMDFRIGIDVMTTESTCLSSVWVTDDLCKEYMEIHGRGEDFNYLRPEGIAYYDGFIEIDLSQIRPMIALPFHPSNVFSIKELNENLQDILRECEKKVSSGIGQTGFSLLDKVIEGKLYATQGIIAGCAGGGFENICDAADIIEGKYTGVDEFALSVYPASTPIYMKLMQNGTLETFIRSGAVVKTAFCGPCFGAGDTPANNGFSIRHTTRNFPNREGSKLSEGQISAVALMDARSIAATAANKGFVIGADEIDIAYRHPKYFFDKEIYDNRVYNGIGAPQKDVELKFGPNIKDWPQIPTLGKDLILKVASKIMDDVTTTDELIPSGETSSFRSNPLRLAEFTLSRRDPDYVGRAKEILQIQKSLEKNENILQTNQEFSSIIETIKEKGFEIDINNIGVGSTIFAKKPGDGSAREQAASSQRVLGGWANIAYEYATKRYRSNLINWGMLPFLIQEDQLKFDVEDYIFIPDVAAKLEKGDKNYTAYVVKDRDICPIELYMEALTEDEKSIIAKGCLMNWYRHNNKI